MKAFHGDPAIKEKYLARVREHARMDRIVQGDGRWCAVGCTLEKYDHAAYETELGIPMAIAHLEDALFELAPWDYAKDWPARFLAAIEPGADLSMVVPHFIYWMLSDEKEGVVNFVNREIYPGVIAAVTAVTGLFRRVINGESVDASEFEAARSAAWSAAESAARSAAESAAWSAAESAAESAAWSAAESAARSAAESAAESAARSAAWSAARSAAESAAESAAWSAAWSAAESAARSAAESAARSAAESARNVRHCEKLLELLAATPLAAKETADAVSI